MKRLFKFFTVAAIIAVGFTGCSSETPLGPDEGTDPSVVSELDGKPTFATFKFSVSDAAQTKSLDVASGEVATPVVTEFRLFVFRADGVLEVDTFSPLGANLTVPLISGAKRIFVLVNGGEDVANLTTPAKAAAFNNYNQFNGLQDLTAAAPPTEFVTALTGVLYGTNGSKFLYTSNVKDAVKTLNPGVSSADSQDTGNSNYVALTVDRAVAKVAVTKTVPSLPTPTLATTGIITRDSTGRIDPATVKYHVWNINKAVYPFQNYDASNVLVTPYGTLAPPFANYYLRNQGNGPTNTYIDAIDRAGEPANSLYRFVTENVPATPYGGNTTYAEVEAIYRPTVGNYAATTIGYNESTETFAPAPATADLATATDMYQFLEEGVLGFPIGTLIAGSDALALAKKVTYHRINPSTPPKATLTDPDYVAITDAQVATYFDKFIGGKAYYRLNFGEQSGGPGTDINFGVKRNYYYDANITGFLTLGANEPGDLLDEGTILQGRTNLTVHITIRPWIESNIDIDI
jgi:hypothetical protein